MSIVTGRRLNYVIQKIKDTFATKSSLNSYLTTSSASNTYLSKTDASSTYASKSRYRDGAGGTNATVIGQGGNALGTSCTVMQSTGNSRGLRSAVIACYEGFTNEDSSGGQYSSGYNCVTMASSYCYAIDEESAVIASEYSCANGDFSSVMGARGCNSQDNQLVTGHYNNSSIAYGSTSEGTGTNTLFCIGNGKWASGFKAGNDSAAASNAFRVDANGKAWAKAAYSSTGADYAELFEWEDGNPNNEDRRGYFVTMVGNKIKKASQGDYILGVVSANPCILGNTDTEWQGQFLKDEFGEYIQEDTTFNRKKLQLVVDEEGNQKYEKVQLTGENGELLYDEKGKPVYIEQPILEEVTVEEKGKFYKINPDYDSTQKYVNRLERPEWDAVGMMGVLSVCDDGTCEIDGFCTVADGGIATNSEYGYRVIERVNENVIKVVISAESNNMIFELMKKIDSLHSND